MILYTQQHIDSEHRPWIKKNDRSAQEKGVLICTQCAYICMYVYICVKTFACTYKLFVSRMQKAISASHKAHAIHVRELIVQRFLRTCMYTCSFVCICICTDTSAYARICTWATNVSIKYACMDTVHVGIHVSTAT